MSPELTAFLKAWLDWAEGDAADGSPFFRTSGLCPMAQMKSSQYPGVYGELKAIFAYEENCGLIDDRVFPFGEGEYDECDAMATMHEDENRLAWVRAKLKEAGVSA